MTVVARGHLRIGVRRAAVLVAAAGLLAACGDTSFTYMKNSDDQTYLRLPRSWDVLQTDQEADPQADVPLPWQRSFDAAGAASLDNIMTYAPTDVVGRLTVFYVTAAAVDQLSAEDIRTAVSPLQADPLTLSEEANAAKGKLRGFTVESRDGGLHGSRVVYDLVSDDGTVATFDQTTLIDPKPYANPKSGGSMYKVYALSVHCQVDCYDRAKDDIDDVISSWTVVR
jgi:hypothetical protein